MADEAHQRVAVELSALVPTVRDDEGFGASIALVGSRRWRELTVHLNGAAAWTRTHAPGAFAGVIVEGPDAWPVRPVGEASVDAERGVPWMRAALVGAIWRASETLSFDAGVRGARAGGETTKELQAAARTLGLELHVLNASTEHDFDGIFAMLIQLRAGGLVISGGPFFASRSEQLAALALHHAVPTIYQDREFAVAGGLLSYGTDPTETYRLAGIYTGRVLKGDKPADLPVQQATKVELFINLKTAKTLGVNVPNTLIGRADELIE